MNNLDENLIKFEISTIVDNLDKVIGHMSIKYYDEEAGYRSAEMRLFLQADTEHRKIIKNENSRRVITDLKRFFEEEYKDFPVLEIIEVMEKRIKSFEENPKRYTEDYVSENLVHKLIIMSLNGTLPQNIDSKYEIILGLAEEDIKR